MCVCVREREGERGKGGEREGEGEGERETDSEEGALELKEQILRVEVGKGSLRRDGDGSSKHCRNGLG